MKAHFVGKLIVVAAYTAVHVPVASSAYLAEETISAAQTQRVQQTKCCACCFCTILDIACAARRHMYVLVHAVPQGKNCAPCAREDVWMPTEAT